MIQKIIKWVAIVLGALVLTVVVIYFRLSEDIPKGIPGEKAEQLTDQMLASLNYTGYKNIETLSWTFRGKHHYVWNKKEQTVYATLDSAIVKLNFSTGQHEVIRNDMKNRDPSTVAISTFYNDSFWLVAPFKIRDIGTSRSYVETSDGPGILVTYSSGGVTPGDTYLWVLDENHRPKYWRLWTSNVPISGLKFEWSNWKQYKGVWLATDHPGAGPLAIDITNLKVD